jgi:hypothetical protein
MIVPWHQVHWYSMHKDRMANKYKAMEVEYLELVEKFLHDATKIFVMRKCVFVLGSTLSRNQGGTGRG